jgi:hypothetical protein
MPEQSTGTDPATQETAIPAPAAPVRDRDEQEDEWLEEPAELPRRPRRRLLTPLPLALAGVLLIACGFIGGVLVEKGQTSTGAAAGAGSGLASRFAALRGGSAGTTAASGSFGARAGGLAGAGRATAGQVAYLAGSALYVTTLEGNTVKVTTSPATSVTKTVSASVKGIHPGETVTVTGVTGANGAISAESIRVGGGAGALFGAGAGAGRGSSSGGSGGGGEPALFGGGG